MRFSLILIEIGGLFMRPLETLFFLLPGASMPGQKSPAFRGTKKALAFLF
jgi:hypothetical protein